MSFCNIISTGFGCGFGMWVWHVGLACGFGMWVWHVGLACGFGMWVWQKTAKSSFLQSK